MKYLDLYAAPFNLTVFNKEKYKTILGGTLTIISVGIMIGVFFLFGADFIYKKNPRTNTIFQKVSNDDIKFHPVTSANYTLMFKMEDVDGVTIEGEKEVLFPYLEYSIYKKDESNSWYTDARAYPAPVKCSQTRAIENELISNYNLDDWYCVDWEEISAQIGKQAYVGGRWSNDHLSILRLRYHSCPFDYKKQAFNMEECASFARITDELATATQYFSIVIPDYLFDTTDVQEPLKTSYNYIFFKVSSSIYLTKYYYYAYVTLNDDEGWVFEYISQSNAMEVKDTETVIGFVKEEDFKTSQNQAFFQFPPIVLNDERKHFRAFIKIQEIIANIGGILKIIMLGFKFVNDFFCYKMRRLHIIREITKINRNRENQAPAQISRNSSSFSLATKKNNLISGNLFAIVVNKHLFCRKSKRNSDLEIKEKELFSLIDVVSLIKYQMEKKSREVNRIRLAPLNN